MNTGIDIGVDTGIDNKNSETQPTPPVTGLRRVMNFESGTVGQPALGDDAGTYTYQGNGCFTQYSDPTLSMYGGAPWNATAHSGSQCCELHWAPGTGNGVGNAPGLLAGFQPGSDFGERIYIGEGDEIWIRTWWWWPSTWQDDPVTGGRSKGIRTRIAPSGWQDIYNGPDSASWTPSSPFNSCTWNSGWGGSQPVGKVVISKPRDVWTCIEWNIKASSSEDTGHYRVWQDDVLHIDDNHCQTINSGETMGIMGLVWAEFHGSSPVSQSMFCDDIIITDNNPGAVFNGTSPSQGTVSYPFIGKDAVT